MVQQQQTTGTAVGSAATKQCIAVMEGVLAGVYGIHLSEEVHSRLISDLRAAIEVAKAEQEGTLTHLKEQVNLETKTD